MHPKMEIKERGALSVWEMFQQVRRRVSGTHTHTHTPTREHSEWVSNEYHPLACVTHTHTWTRDDGHSWWHRWWRRLRRKNFSSKSTIPTTVHFPSGFPGKKYETGSHVWVGVENEWKRVFCYIFNSEEQTRQSACVPAKNERFSFFLWWIFVSHYRAGFFLCDLIRDFAMVCVRASIPFMVVLVARAGGVCGAQWPSGWTCLGFWEVRERFFCAFSHDRFEGRAGDVSDKPGFLTLSHFRNFDLTS